MLHQDGEWEKAPGSGSNWSSLRERAGTCHNVWAPYSTLLVLMPRWTGGGCRVLLDGCQALPSRLGPSDCMHHVCVIRKTNGVGSAQLRYAGSMRHAARRPT